MTTESREPLHPDDKVPADVIKRLGALQEEDTPFTGCLPCGIVVRMGFFFDAFGRHRDQDDPASSMYSNICRLWEAHRDPEQPLEPNRRWYRMYYSGLGTPLNEDAELDPWLGLSAGIGQRIREKVMGTAGGAMTNTALRASRLDRPVEQANLVKRAEAALKDALEETSLRPLVRAYDDLKRDLAHAPQTAGRVMHV